VVKAGCCSLKRIERIDAHTYAGAGSAILVYNFHCFGWVGKCDADADANAAAAAAVAEGQRGEWQSGRVAEFSSHFHRAPSRHLGIGIRISGRAGSSLVAVASVRSTLDSQLTAHSSQQIANSSRRVAYS